jgi:hypothetical protein
MGSQTIDSAGLFVAIAFAVAVGLFLLLRMFWLWYFRINEIVRLLRSIDESLRQLPAVRSYDSSGQRIANI